jgi:hypothetical protein
MGERTSEFAFTFWFMYYFIEQRTSKLHSHFVIVLKSAFTPNVKSILNENLGGILRGTQCKMGGCLILS